MVLDIHIIIVHTEISADLSEANITEKRDKYEILARSSVGKLSAIVSTDCEASKVERRILKKSLKSRFCSASSRSLYADAKLIYSQYLKINSTQRCISYQSLQGSKLGQGAREQVEKKKWVSFSPSLQVARES